MHGPPSSVLQVLGPFLPSYFKNKSTFFDGYAATDGVHTLVITHLFVSDY